MENSEWRKVKFFFDVDAREENIVRLTSRRQAINELAVLQPAFSEAHIQALRGDILRGMIYEFHLNDDPRSMVMTGKDILYFVDVRCLRPLQSNSVDQRVTAYEDVSSLPEFFEIRKRIFFRGVGRPFKARYVLKCCMYLAWRCLKEHPLVKGMEAPF